MGVHVDAGGGGFLNRGLMLQPSREKCHSFAIEDEPTGNRRCREED